MSLSNCEWFSFPSSSTILECHLCNMKTALSKILMTFYFHVFVNPTLSPLPITLSTYILCVESNTVWGWSSWYCSKWHLMVQTQIQIQSQMMMTTAKICESCDTQRCANRRTCFSSVSWSLVQWNIIASWSILLNLIWINACYRSPVVTNGLNHYLVSKFQKLFCNDGPTSNFQAFVCRSPCFCWFC